ncbi:MAG: hypothetical protein CR967_04985 [Proteobacteria bacterium]|nr:MAG: hypothetical protein CR967_04985 [Pseudomonadota bacterium]
MYKFFASLFSCFFIFSTTTFADILQNQIVTTSIGILKVFDQDYNGTNKEFKLPKRFSKDKIKAVAIIPDLAKGGFLVSAQKGDGIFCIKDENGDWSDPLFIEFKGIGLGIQGGYLSNDAVLLFENTRSYSGIFSQSKTIDIGGDASIIGGASSHHMTDIPELGANILAIGRSDGIFLGMSLNNSLIKVHDQNNIDYYGRLFLDQDIINGSPKDSKYTKQLKLTLRQVFNKK